MSAQKVLITPTFTSAGNGTVRLVEGTPQCISPATPGASRSYEQWVKPCTYRVYPSPGYRLKRIVGTYVWSWKDTEDGAVVSEEDEDPVTFAYYPDSSYLPGQSPFGRDSEGLYMVAEYLGYASSPLPEWQELIITNTNPTHVETTIGQRSNIVVVAEFERIPHTPTHLLVNSSTAETPAKLVYDPTTNLLVGDY